MDYQKFKQAKAIEKKNKERFLKVNPRVVEWAERLGVTPHCLLHRKELGWDIERILTTPLKGDNNGKAKL